MSDHAHQRTSTAASAAEKAASLRTAASAASERERAEADEVTAIRQAARAGASTREIAKATNRNHATVARIITRADTKAGG